MTPDFDPFELAIEAALDEAIPVYTERQLELRDVIYNDMDLFEQRGAKAPEPPCGGTYETRPESAMWDAAQWARDWAHKNHKQLCGYCDRAVQPNVRDCGRYRTYYCPACRNEIATVKREVA